MKYAPEVSENENRRRWLSHAQRRGPLRHFGLLPAGLRTQAWKLAATLANLEVRICRQIVPILDELGRRKGDPSDELEDYDITLTLTYRLRQPDPEWEEFDENILCVQSFSTYEANDLSIATGFGKLRACTPWPEWSGKPVCWTFLDLMESGLAWEDLPRIESIGLSLEVKTDEAPIPV